MKLIESILNQMCAVSKPQKKFLLKAFEGFLGIMDKLTFSSMSRYTGISDRTFRRQFSQEFNFAEFNRKTIDEFYGERPRTLAFAFDPFHIPKSGDKTYGKGKFWSGVDGCVKEGIEGSLGCIIDLENHFAFALCAHQTPDATEFKDVHTRIDWFVECITATKPYIPQEVAYCLVDAYFFKEKFVAGVCDRGLHVISKMRKDAQLRALYSGEQKARGRHRKFEGAVHFNDLEVLTTDDPAVTLRATVAYSVALKRNILVVQVRKQLSQNKCREALLYSTDIAMKPLDVYRFYAARFQIEFVIRDAKQHTGLTDCQSTSKERLNFHINTSLAATNLARRAEYQPAQPATPCSVATQRIKHHNEMLIRSIFPILGLDPLAFKSNPNYEQALAFGTK
jgi:hypothetical protein